jgi:hypothetical protein
LQAAINAHYTTIVIFFWGVSKQEVLALGWMDRNAFAFC